MGRFSMVAWMVLVLLCAGFPSAGPASAALPAPVENQGLLLASAGNGGLGGDTLLSVAQGPQLSPALAYNPAADEVLVVWEDHRHEADSASDVYGQLFSMQGLPLGEAFAICSDPQAQDGPAVTYNPTADEYLVAWADYSSLTYYEIAVQRVSADGLLVGDKVVVSPSGTDHHFNPELVYDANADHYLVVWDNLVGHQVDGQLLDGAAVPLLPEPIAIASGGAHPRVVYNSHLFSYLVVYYHFLDLDIYGQAVAGDGSLSGPSFVICGDPSAQYDPAVAFNTADHEYLVVWQDLRNSLSSGTDIMGRRIAEDGSPLGIEIVPSSSAEDQYGANVVYNPEANQYLVVWMDQRNEAASGLDLYGQRVQADGSLVAQGNFAILSASGDAYSPDAVYSTAAHQYLVVWMDLRSSQLDIYGQRLHWLGFPLGSEFVVSGALESQEDPSVAYNSVDQEYLVVWADDRDGDGQNDVWAQRYGSSGIPRGENLVVREEAGDQTRPAVAYCPAANNYLVVWDDLTEEDVEGQLLTAQGGHYDAAFNVGEGSGSAVLYNAQEDSYLVVFAHQDGGTGELDIHGRHISPGGPGGMGTEFAICEEAGDQHSPAVAYDGDLNRYLVVWADERNDAGDIYGRLVWPDGQVGTEQVYAQEADAQLYPVLAWNESDYGYLVAWHDYRESGVSGADIYGQLLNQAGAPSAGSIAISTAEGDQQYPYVNYIGANDRYYVGWQDNRSGAVGGWDLYGRWVAADGSPASLNLPVFRYSGWQLRPAGAYSPDQEQGIVVWQDGRNGEAYKVYARLGVLDLEPPEAQFTREPTVGVVGTTFTFDARSSWDNAAPSGWLLVRWDWTSDGTWDTALSLEKVVTRTVGAPGVYTVTLGVWDTMLYSDTVSHAIVVLPDTGNTPPTAALTVTPALVEAGAVVTLDASGSTDAETPGSLLARWDWEDDGEWDTGFGGTLVVTHAYTEAGDHTARVEVRDGGNLTAGAVGNVTVVPGPAVLLVVLPGNATMAPGEVLPFRALAWDGYGNLMANPAVSWAVSDPLAGEIGASGVFTASHEPGEYPDVVQAEIDGVSDSASVTIYEVTYTIYLPLLMRHP